jgi:hypothetical protein
MHCVSLHNNQMDEMKLDKNDYSVHTFECTVKYFQGLV